MGGRCEGADPRTGGEIDVKCNDVLEDVGLDPSKKQGTLE